MNARSHPDSRHFPSRIALFCMAAAAFLLIGLIPSCAAGGNDGTTLLRISRNGLYGPVICP